MLHHILPEYMADLRIVELVLLLHKLIERHHHIVEGSAIIGKH